MVEPLHVAVLMGGWSSERRVSLVSGAACAEALRSGGFRVTEIDMERPDLAALLAALTPAPDVVFNALHGRGPGFTVETRALDGYLEHARGKRVFLKLDTQGHELDVFAGARALFAAAAEVTVLFEFWPHGLRQAGRDPREVFEVQAELGCTGHTLSDAGELLPLDPERLLAELEGEQFTSVVWTRAVAAR